MIKETKRALRRHHLARMKARAIRVYYFHSPEQAIKYANHLQVCSCYGCGNQRRHSGPSLQELRRFQKD